jgi:signal peptidase II
MSQPIPSMVPISRYAAFLLLSGAGLSWDLYTKWSVFSWLGCPAAGPWVWPDNWGWNSLSPIVRFQIHTNFNHGALWGMGQGMSLLFACFSVAAALAILYWLFVHKGAASWWLTVALGLVMAGVLGNLFDRLGLHGWIDEDGRTIHAVRDFLHFWFFEGTPAHFDWAIFNFADTYLVTGAIMLVIQSLFLHPASASPATVSSVPASTTNPRIG